MPTKDEVQAWVREEWARLEAEKQAACGHARSGTLRDQVVICDDCGKALGDDDGPADEPSDTARRAMGMRAS